MKQLQETHINPDQGPEPTTTALPRPIAATVCMIDLEAILDPIVKTPVSQDHVGELEADIAEHGLIAPIAIDQDNQLLAGRHRLAAIKQLRDNNPEAFAQQFPNEQVPIMRLTLNREDKLAEMKTLVAENSIRRTWSATEVQSIINLLVEQGYRNAAGRPPKGQVTAREMAAQLCGRSKAWVKLVTSNVHAKDTKPRTTEVAGDGAGAPVKRGRKPKADAKPKVIQVAGQQTLVNPAGEIDGEAHELPIVDQPPVHDDAGVAIAAAHDDHVDYVHQSADQVDEPNQVVEFSTVFTDAQAAVRQIPEHEHQAFRRWLADWMVGKAI